MAYRVVITGPESTGKTELASFLSEKLHGRLIPEYARYYVSNLDRSYSFSDVEHIGKWQKEHYHSVSPEERLVVLDTWLIITRVWFESVFQKVPIWIDDELSENKPDLCLLCYPDIAWQPDSVRENGGQMRFVLYEKYEELLKKHAYPYQIIKGSGVDRKNNALKVIHERLNIS